MKNLIKISLCISVLVLTILYSKPISNYVAETYNGSVEFLASNIVKSSNPLRF